MRRDREKRRPALRSQCCQVIKAIQRGNFFRGHVEQNHVRALEPHFRGRNEENPHPRRIRKNFDTIEDRVMQRDGEDAKAKSHGALEQFVRGIIEGVLRVVQGMDMQIELDPFAFSHAAETYTAIRYFGASDERIFSKRGSPRKGSQNGISFN